MFKNNISYKIRGFSLAEIVIAVAILGSVLITVCGVFVHGLHAIKMGRYRACAIHIANQKFVELEEADWSSPAGLPTDKLSSPPPDGVIGGFTDYDDPYGNGDYLLWSLSLPFEIEGYKIMAGTEYRFKIKIEHYLTNLKKVRIEVKWDEPGGEKTLELCKLMARKQ